jgi:hypothetical protein
VYPVGGCDNASKLRIRLLVEWRNDISYYNCLRNTEDFIITIIIIIIIIIIITTSVIIIIIMRMRI